MTFQSPRTLRTELYRTDLWGWSTMRSSPRQALYLRQISTTIA